MSEPTWTDVDGTRFGIGAILETATRPAERFLVVGVAPEQTGSDEVRCSDCAGTGLVPCSCLSARECAHRGSTKEIVEALGIGVATYQRWLVAYPEIAEVHRGFRTDSTRGPVPAEPPKRRRAR